MYGYRTLRPEDGYTSQELGYVGQTRQKLWSRDGQHREVQPWEDIIVGRAFVIAQGVWTDDELDEAERAAIARLRPRYNIDCNRANRDRITPWTAGEQRRARDAAAGRLVWSPPVVAAASVSWPRRLVARAVTAVRVWWSRVWWWPVSWLTVTLAVGGACLWQAPGATAQDSAVTGGMAATGLLALVAKLRRPKRRRKPSRRRRWR